jgi:hypothetical protein
MDKKTQTIEKLKAFTLEGLRSISHETGVPYNTILRLRYQQTKFPQYDTIAPLISYFENQEAA